MQNKKLIVENKIYYWVRIDEMTTQNIRVRVLYRFNRDE